MEEKKLYSWLGMCMRAGKLVSGDETTLKCLKSKKLNLVIIAEDASNNTKKLFKDKSSFRNIEYVEFGDKNSLGLAIGKSPRAVLGIMDKNMADKLRQLLPKGL